MSASPAAGRPAGSRRAVRAILAVLVGVLLGGVAGLLVPHFLHKTYTATSRVLVSATGIDTTAQPGAKTNSGINLDTEAQLVTSSAVVQRAVQAYPTLADQTFEQLVQHITVSVPANTTVLQIAFNASSAHVAQRGANALATAYLDDRASTAKGLLTAREHNAEQRGAALQKQIDTLTQQATVSPTGSTLRRTLQSRIDILKNQINGLNNQLVAFSAIQITPGRVVTAASLPTSPTSPSRVIWLASGLGIGLLLGLLAAWLLNRFRRKVRRPEDIADVVDLDTIAVLPRLDKGGAALIEPFRRVALITTSAVRDADCILFTTPGASPSGSRVATGVAAALVRAGTAVGLLRVNAQGVGGPKPRGLDLISVPNTDAVARKRGESLDAALDRVRGGKDLLVVDAAGATLSADAQAVAAVADAVVLVVDSGTRSKAIRQAVRALDEVRAPMLGIVLVRGGLRPPSAERDDALLAADGHDVLDPPSERHNATGRPAEISSSEPADDAPVPLVLGPPAPAADGAVTEEVEEEPPTEEVSAGRAEPEPAAAEAEPEPAAADAEPDAVPDVNRTRYR